MFAGRLQISLDSSTPYLYTLYIPPLLYLLILPSLRSLQDVHVSRNGQAGTVSRAPVMLIAAMAVFILLAIASEAAVSTFFNVYMDNSLGVPTATIGVIVATGKLLSVPAALGTPLMAVRWGNFRTIFGGVLGLAVGALLLASASQWLGADLGYITVIVLVGILHPLQTIFHQEIVMPEWRSPMSGAANVAEKVGRAAMVGIGGFLIAWLGYKTMFTSAALVTLTGAFYPMGILPPPN